MNIITIQQQIIVRLVLAALLLICLFDMPYGYYQLVRFIATSVFILLAFQTKNRMVTFAFLALAVLFQPFIKIVLGRSLWNIVDVVVAVLLIISVLALVKPDSK